MLNLVVLSILTALAPSNQAAALACTDTDGISFYTQGTTCDATGKCSVDTCDANTVTEYYCKGQKMGTLTYQCSNSCMNGGCYYQGYYMSTDKYYYSHQEVISLQITPVAGMDALLDLYVVPEPDAAVKIIKNVAIDGTGTTEVAINISGYPVFDASGEYLLKVCDAGLIKCNAPYTNSLLVEII